ncbi:MAG: hypothetical protein BWK73_26740 [Thiothrix lacustris]|uniref:Uncharacterized protein n=1 Tax=Thiothrix lacustris TaxID=525917 RepID=A0A1Y1QKG5_9GAMM|nr:MAG: hypothetical protein BWK73_26740 [Thiothrix lacustris]
MSLLELINEIAKHGLLEQVALADGSVILEASPNLEALLNHPDLPAFLAEGAQSQESLSHRSPALPAS